MGKPIRTLTRYAGRRPHLRPPSVALLLTAAIIAPVAGTTHAGVICRSDPVLVVNGSVVDVVSSLQTDASAVRELDYQITIPSGSLVGKLTLTVGLGFPEKVTYVFSPALSWGSIRVAASVVTQDGAASFPVSVQVSSLLAGSSTASGTSAATMTVALDHLLML